MSLAHIRGVCREVSVVASQPSKARWLVFRKMSSLIRLIAFHSLKTFRRHKKEHWDVTGRRWLLLVSSRCCSVWGLAHCIQYGGGKGISTKQLFSTTSITGMRLCYLQMVMGQAIFIKQFCFYSLSGNFCGPWLKDLALRLMYIFFLNVVCHFWNCPWFFLSS